MIAAGKRRKGSGGERELVRLLTEAGIPARRVPLSGAMKDTGFGGDVLVLVKCHHCRRWDYECDHPEKFERKYEVKRRAQGWKKLYQYLADNYAVAVRADGDTSAENWLVTLRLSDFVELLKR